MSTQKPVPLGPWLGVDNVHLPTHKVFQFPSKDGGLSALVAAVDVDLLDDGWVKSREGATTVLSATTAKYLGSKGGLLLLQDGEVLYKVVGTTPTSLITGLTGQVVAHEFPVGGAQVLVTDGVTSRRIISGTVTGWGLQVPTTPTITRTSGDLPPGSYLITTSLRTGSLTSQSAQEGGAQPLIRYTLTTTGGLSITQPVTDPFATHVTFYVSRCDAPVPFRISAQAVSAGSATLTVPINTMLGSSDLPPVTLDWGPPPAGITHLGSWQGFLLASVGSYLYRAWPGQPNLWWPIPIVFGSTITSIVGLVDGFYVGTSAGLFWVKGDPEPSNWGLNRVDSAAILPEGAVVPGHAIPSLEANTPVALFVAKDGVIAALPGGAAKRLTYSRYHFTTATGARIAYCVDKRQLLLAITS